MENKEKGTGGRYIGVAVLWWEDIDIASVITASGPAPAHMCRPQCRRGTPCDTHILWCQKCATNIYETRPRAGLRPARPSGIVGRVHLLHVHFSRLASRLRRSARSNYARTTLCKTDLVMKKPDLRGDF